VQRKRLARKFACQESARHSPTPSSADMSQWCFGCRIIEATNSIPGWSRASGSVSCLNHRLNHHDMGHKSQECRNLSHH
jgi:hypothetical protein